MNCDLRSMRGSMVGASPDDFGPLFPSMSEIAN
jgi:hypothetical protein